MKVEIYTTENCYNCHKTKEFLDKRGIEYVEHNVTDNIEKARDIFRLSGQLGVPLLIVDDEIIVGYNEKKLKELFDGTGN